ncbi:MAG TPA: hypothetical protein DC056_12215 [Dehalococcoidia bacterium]|nr:hypothetical protein [Dehalococcoidia bacterium]
MCVKELLVVASSDIASTVARTKEYYDGPADEIYRFIWGDNIHLGVPCGPACPHPEAMEHTNEIMAGFANLEEGSKVLDLGCGYGATARYLARNYGCSVVGINISEKELELAQVRGVQENLQDSLTFESGDFHRLKYGDESFNVVWSQEAFLHGADKDTIITESKRVLMPGGTLIFTDLLVKSGTTLSERERIYQRVRTPEMWDVSDYHRSLMDQGFEVIQTQDWSLHVARSYSWIRNQIEENREKLSAKLDSQTIHSTLESLAFWVDSANAGKIGWALLVAVKPAA